MFYVQIDMKSPTQPVTRELLWEILKSPETKRNITMFRKTGKAFYKTSLPGFTYQARFTESEKDGVKGCWRLQSNAVLTGLCMLDVDHVENPKAIIDGWLAKGEAWLKEQGVLMIFITPLGQRCEGGVHRPHGVGQPDRQHAGDGPAARRRTRRQLQGCLAHELHADG